MSLIQEKHEYRPVDSCEEGTEEERRSAHYDNIESIWRRRFYILLAVALSIFSLIFTASVLVFGTSSCPPPKPGAEIPYCESLIVVNAMKIPTDKQPAPAPVTYVNKWLKGDIDTPKFVGQPRPEMDEAWHDLLSGTAIRFSEEELKLANNATSIEHKDGGYVGGLGISHSLHCVVSRLTARTITFVFIAHSKATETNKAVYASRLLLPRAAAMGRAILPRRPLFGVASTGRYVLG